VKELVFPYGILFTHQITAKSWGTEEVRYLKLTLEEDPLKGKSPSGWLSQNEALREKRKNIITSPTTALGGVVILFLRGS